MKTEVMARMAVSSYNCPHCGGLIRKSAPFFKELIGPPRAICPHCSQGYKTYMDHWSSKSAYGKIEVVVDAAFKGVLLMFPVGLMVFIIVHIATKVRYPDMPVKFELLASACVTAVLVAIRMVVQVRGLIRQYP